MRHEGTWSVSLGRWGGVDVRLHMFFLLFAACTLFLGWRERLVDTGNSVTIASISLAILFVSVLLHELSHCHAMLRMGGEVDEIVLGPLGGLKPLCIDDDPQAEAFVHLAGPLANLFLCLLCATLLLAQGDQALWGLLNPLSPQDIGSLKWPHDLWRGGLRLGLWINWVLLLVNLLPAAPFDGGRALRAVLAPLWHQDGYFYAGMIVSRLAKLVALVLFVVAVFLATSQAKDAVAATLMPAWFPLMVLAILLFFIAQSEEARLPRSENADEDEALGYDFLRGEPEPDPAETEATKPPPAPSGPFSRWLEERREARRRRQEQLEQDEERRVDEILARLHLHGLESLSGEDRSLLERVSARYRNRQRQR